MPNRIRTKDIDDIIYNYLKYKIENDLDLFHYNRVPSNYINYNKLNIYNNNIPQFKPSENSLLDKGNITSLDAMLAFFDIASYYSTVGYGVYGVSGDAVWLGYGTFFLNYGFSEGDGREYNHDEHMSNLVNVNTVTGTIIKNNYINLYKDLYNYIVQHRNTRIIDLTI